MVPCLPSCSSQDTWESSLRPVFPSLLPFNPSQVLSSLPPSYTLSLASLPLCYHPSAHQHHLLSGLLQIPPEQPPCPHFRQPSPFSTQHSGQSSLMILPCFNLHCLPVLVRRKIRILFVSVTSVMG